ncbi:MAG TPA: heavy metal-associated domain-containing protein [Pirellulales bacterium]
MSRIEISIQGLNDAASARAVKRKLQVLPGVTHVNVDLPTRRAIVDVEGRADTHALSDAVERAGFLVLSSPTTQLDPSMLSGRATLGKTRL